jgi:hypothetical protein
LRIREQPLIEGSMIDAEQPTASDLIGAWRLESWALVYEDGRAPEYPLGSDAKGFILYTTDGHVSATLARARRSPQAISQRKHKPTTTVSPMPDATRCATAPCSIRSKFQLIRRSLASRRHGTSC